MGSWCSSCINSLQFTVLCMKIAAALFMYAFELHAQLRTWFAKFVVLFLILIVNYALYDT